MRKIRRNEMRREEEMKWTIQGREEDNEVNNRGKRRQMRRKKQ